jgi:hypothetical protein
LRRAGRHRTRRNLRISAIAVKGRRQMVCSASDPLRCIQEMNF